MMFAVTLAVNAMHIMEGYLPVKYCIAWGVICVPFLVAGLISLKKIKRKQKDHHIDCNGGGVYLFS